MPLVDTLAERFPNLDLTHRDTLHRLADRLGRGNVPTETSLASKDIMGNMKKTTCEETGKYRHSKRVGPYLLGKNLGEGSFAKVKEAMHSVIGEKVAMKIVDKKSIRDDVYLRKNMRREAAILQTLHHPNIVRLYEVMETDNNFYMVLELCTGGPLLDKICSEGKLKEDTARRYVKQMLSAVDHMHQAGVLHRDLKVENLLLDGTGNLKIIDFGLSNFLGRISRNGRLRTDMQATQCGSPAYAAPEIIANKRYGAKVDVWSVGVNTFAMLTGTLPFIVEPFNIKVLLRKMITKDMTQMPKQISKDCQDFIKQLLQPDPRARPSVRDVMSHHWITEGRPGSSRPRTATPPPSGRLSRMDVDTDIVDLIWNTYGIQPSHVSNSVIYKRADEYSAIYYLLIRKRDREDVRVMRREFNKKVAHVQLEHKSGAISGNPAEGENRAGADKEVLAEMTALQLAGRKHGSLHFKVTTLAINEESDEQLQQLDDDTQSDTRSHDEKETGHVDTVDDHSECPLSKLRQGHETIKKKVHEDQTENYQDRQSSPVTKVNRNGKHRHPTATTRCTDKTKNFREAFTSARTSAVVKRQLDRRVSDIKTGPFHKQPRIARGSLFRKDEGILNCAHKVNLTFRQSDPGSKGSFTEHFNYRNRKRDYVRPANSPNGRAVVKLNLTPVYSPLKSPRKSKKHMKDSDGSKNTSITIKQQSPSKSRQTTLSKLIDDVQIANVPPEFDVSSLTQTQQEAMATFRSTRGQKKKHVPSEFERIESTRRVMVAKRKSIDVQVPATKIQRKRASLSSKHCVKPRKSPSRLNRRKLSTEETLERYRSRNPARSPCMCQLQEDGNEKTCGVGYENHANPKLQKKTSSSTSRGRENTLPDIAPPLIAISPRLKPLSSKAT